MPYRSLEDLRSELSVRLGFGASGAPTGANAALLDSFLRQCQDELYWQASWAELRSREDLTIGVGQTLVSYPVDANKQRIEAIYVRVAETWLPVVEGIDKSLYTTVDSQSYPARYERLDQLEFWPEADQTYTIRVWYYKELLPFTQNADVATVRDSLVLTRAIGLAKAHYRHPDAQSQIERGLEHSGNAKGGAWSQKVFRAPGRDDPPIPMPRTV